jgi:transcriptional regulator with XRE-family HTH domain
MTVFIFAAEDGFAKKNLAELLKILRNNDTQRQFAKRLGTSYTSVQNWEKQIRLPSEKNLQRIAQLQGWTYEKLVVYLFTQSRESHSITQKH